MQRAGLRELTAKLAPAAVLMLAGICLMFVSKYIDRGESPEEPQFLGNVRVESNAREGQELPVVELSDEDLEAKIILENGLEILPSELLRLLAERESQTLIGPVISPPDALISSEMPVISYGDRLQYEQNPLHKGLLDFEWQREGSSILLQVNPAGEVAIESWVLSPESREVLEDKLQRAVQNDPEWRVRLAMLSGKEFSWPGDSDSPEMPDLEAGSRWMQDGFPHGMLDKSELQRIRAMVQAIISRELEPLGFQLAPDDTDQQSEQPETPA